MALSSLEKAELHKLEQLKALLDEHGNAPKKKRSLPAEVLRQVGRAGRAGAVGVASVGDLPNLGALALHKAGVKKEPEFYRSPSEALKEHIDKITGGRLKPESKGEEYADTVMESVLPLGAEALLNPAGAVIRGGGKAVRAAHKALKASQLGQAGTAKNMGAAAGASAAVKAYGDASRQNHEDPGMLASLAAAYAGGAAGSGLSRSGRAVAYRKLTGFDPEKYAREQELGMRSTLGSTGNALMRAGEKDLLRPVFSGKALEEIHEGNRDVLKKKLGLDKAGEKITGEESAVRRYQERAGDLYKGRQAVYEDVLERLRDKRAPVDVSALKDHLAGKKRHLDSGFSQQVFEESVPGDTLKRLRKYGNKDDGSIPYGEFEQLKDTLVSKERTLRGTEPGSQGHREASQLARKTKDMLEHVATDQGGMTDRQKLAMKRGRSFWAQYKDEGKGTAHEAETLKAMEPQKRHQRIMGAEDPAAVRVYMHGLPKQERSVATARWLDTMGEGDSLVSKAKEYMALKEKKPESLRVMLSGYDKKMRQDVDAVMSYVHDHKQWFKDLESAGHDKTGKMIADFKKLFGATGAGALVGGFSGAAVPGALWLGWKKAGPAFFSNPGRLHRMSQVVTHGDRKGHWMKRVARDILEGDIHRSAIKGLGHEVE